MSTTHEDFNAQIIDEFRANEGRVGGMFAGSTLLLSHHTGAQSGTPVVYMRGGERYVIFASKAGALTNPAWYHNLKARPDTEVEVGTETIPVHADEATGNERERPFEAQTKISPQFGEYQRKTDRLIPVIVLTPR